MAERYIYTPTAIQEEFHSSSDDYIVLGGSRGSGKSYCLLIEALGISYESHINGHWQAMIIRRTIPQLQELIVRAKDLYPKIIKGIKYVEEKKMFLLMESYFHMMTLIIVKA